LDLCDPGQDKIWHPCVDVNGHLAFCIRTDFFLNSCGIINLKPLPTEWQRDLRRRSAAGSLLRLWVRIQSGHGCLSVVSVVCFQVEVSATS